SQRARQARNEGCLTVVTMFEGSAQRCQPWMQSGEAALQIFLVFARERDEVLLSPAETWDDVSLNVTRVKQRFLIGCHRVIHSSGLNRLGPLLKRGSLGNR